MPTEPAVESFLELLELSGIVPENQLKPLLEELGRRTELDTSPKIADELVAREVLTRWQADKLLEGKHKGFLLGTYRILEPLGKGGMGTVYLAQHQVMRRRSAIKVLPTKSAEHDSSMLDRFYREAQAVAALDHPNIVRAYDVNKELKPNTEIHYLVMEYVEGQDLQAKVDEGGVLNYREAAEYIRQAAEGLAHAHEAGLVHRDVKPANLLVDTKGVVKILDLGLARFFDDRENTSLTNEFGDTVLGTVDYLAPEQALDCHEVDARVDIYSLGQTLYFLLTGHPPFPTGSVAQRLMAHQTRSPEPIENERPDVPRDLVAIFEIMTAKKPEERYQTAREVADTLNAWLHDHLHDSGLIRRSSLLTRRFQPPSYREPTRASSSAAEDTELELAPLEEEEKPSRPAFAAPADKSETAQETAKEVSPDSGAVPIADESVAPSVSADSAAGSPESAAPPVPVADLPDLGPPQDDWMSKVLEEAAVSAPVADLGPKTLPRLDKPPPSKAKKTEEGVFGKLVRMPVFWVGIAGAVVVVIVLIVLILSMRTREPAQPTASVPRPSQRGSPQAPAPSEEKQETPAPEVVDAGEATVPQPQQKPAEAGPGQPGGGPPGPDEATDRDQGRGPSGPGAQAGPTPPPSARGPAQAAEPGSPTAAPPTAQPQPRRGTPRQLPSGLDAGDAQPSKEPPKLDPAEMRARLAAITGLAFQLVKSPDHNPASKLNMLVRQEAIRAAEQAGLKTAEDEAVVMYLTLETTEVDGLVGFVMSAQLKEKGNGDSEPVTIWEHKDTVATVSPRLLRRPTLPTPLKTGVSDFFDRFVRDHRQAQAGK